MMSSRHDPWLLDDERSPRTMVCKRTCATVCGSLSTQKMPVGLLPTDILLFSLFYLVGWQPTRCFLLLPPPRRQKLSGISFINLDPVDMIIQLRQSRVAVQSRLRTIQIIYDIRTIIIINIRRIVKPC